MAQTQEQQNPSAAKIQEFLKDADYPASRDDLVILAEANSAPDDVLDILEAMPDVDYENPTDVQESFGDTVEFGKGKQSRGDEQQSSQSRQEGGSRVQSAPPRRSRRHEIEERKRRLKEETGKLTEPGKTVQGEPDHRLKGQETDAIRSARHMERGYDGRGQVTDPNMDARLAENRARPEGEEVQSEPPRQKEGGSPGRKTWREHSSNR